MKNELNLSRRDHFIILLYKDNVLLYIFCLLVLHDFWNNNSNEELTFCCRLIWPIKQCFDYNKNEKQIFSFDAISTDGITV